MRYVGIAEQIACKQRACKACPAAVCTSAVDTCADGVFFIAEYADTVVIGGQEHNIFRNSVFTAECIELVRTYAETSS